MAHRFTFIRQNSSKAELNPKLSSKKKKHIGGDGLLTHLDQKVMHKQFILHEILCLPIL